MTKLELVEALSRVPDHTKVYFVDKRTCKGRPAHFLDDELVKVSGVKVQKANLGVTVDALNYTEDGPEIRRVEVTSTKIILV